MSLLLRSSCRSSCRSLWRPVLSFCAAFTVVFAVGPAFSAPAPEADKGDDALVEIVVTAERREENIEKTAISITAISGQELLQEGASKLDDVVENVPGVKVIGGPAGFLVRIRGEGLNIPPTAGDPSVPIMTDGLYNTQITTTLYGIYDIDHVEVLRGPQGTLFGKNSTGGLVNFVTANPKFNSTEGMVSVAVGNYSSILTQAMYNAPISSDLAFRVAISTASHDGYLTNGDNGQDSKSVRAKLLYKPDDQFTALIGVETSINGGTPPGSVIGWGTGDPNASDPHGSSNPWYDPAPGGNYWHAQYQRYWADLQYDFRWATLSVLPSVQNFSIEWRNNFANGGDVPSYQAALGGYQESSQLQYAAEVHLASPEGQAWNWLVGYYYYNTPDWNSPSNSFGTVTNPTCGPATGEVAAVGLYPTCINYTRSIETIRDNAVFGQTTIPLTGALRATLGGRVTANRKTFNYIDNPEAATAPYLEYWNVALSTTQFTYKAGLEFDLAPTSLLYLQSSSGFISGAFNFNSNTVSPPETLKAYEFGSKNRFLDDRLQINAELFDNEIKNSQSFYTLPNPYLNGTTITSPQTINVVVPATARSYGGEIEAQWRLTASDQVDLSAAYLHARFLRFSNECVGLGVGCPGGPPSIVHFGYDGSVLPQSPDWTVTLRYSHAFQLPNGGNVTAEADSSYHTKYYLVFNYRDFPPYSVPPPFPANEAEVQGDHTSNASLFYHSPDGKWSLGANIKNMEDTATKTGFFGPSVQIADPRTYNATVIFHF